MGWRGWLSFYVQLVTIIILSLVAGSLAVMLAEMLARL